MNRSKKSRILHPDNKDGIYLYEYPLINGIRQYIQVRGTNRNNPLLLFIHGGPGGSVAGLCHVLQEGWEEKFTVVNWDQRYTCKTHLANKDNVKDISGTGSMDDYINDIHQIITYLHTIYEFDKLILMGFSWGSTIGAEYARSHPENLLCYIGVGQLVNYFDSLNFVCTNIEKSASESNNISDVEKIHTFMAGIPHEAKMAGEFIALLRSYSMLAAKYCIKSAKPFPKRKLLQSPFLNLREKIYMVKTDYTLFDKTYTTMLSYDFRANMDFKVPLLFMFGNEDFSCPVTLFEECYDKICAPLKEIEIIQNASHTCFFDQPDIFLNKVDGFINML